MDWNKSFIKFKKEFRAHAIDRMVQRDISFDEIKELSENLKIISEYPEDSPYPSCLSLGFTTSNRPIHIVFSVNKKDKIVFIISIYEPDENIWNAEFDRRK